MKLLKQFGNRFRRVRKQRGLGIRAAARQAGVSPATLSRIENGHDSTASAFLKLVIWAKAEETEG